MGVTGRSQDLEDTVFNLEERNIKGSSTEIVYDDLAFGSLLVKSIGNSCGGRLVDDSENIETGDDTGVFCSLSLVVVEIGRNGDNGVLDRFAKVALSDLCKDMISLDPR